MLEYDPDDIALEGDDLFRYSMAAVAAALMVGAATKGAVDIFALHHSVLSTWPAWASSAMAFYSWQGFTFRL